MYVSVCVDARICVQIHVSAVHVHVEARGEQYVFLGCSPSYFFEAGTVFELGTQ